MRVGCSAEIDVHGEIPGAGAVFGQADHHQAERLERLGHVQVADIQRTKPETLEEGRDARLRLGVVGRDERVEPSTLGKYVTEDRVERLHDMRAGDAVSSLLRTGTAGGSDKARKVGGNRIGD